MHKQFWITEYTIIESEDDLIISFHEKRKKYFKKDINNTAFSLVSKNSVYNFCDLKELPLEKMRKLSSIILVINSDNEKQAIETKLSFTNSGLLN